MSETAMTSPFTPSDELVEKVARAIGGAEFIEDKTEWWEGHVDEARAAIAVIAPMLGAMAAEIISVHGGANSHHIAAALRAHFGVPSAPTPREESPPASAGEE